MEIENSSSVDIHWMHHALKLARRAEQEHEVPVGAVLVREGEIIGEGWNQPISANDPTAHAEIIALRNAATNVDNYRLPDTTLYVTLEPCIMCAGAIIHARAERVVFGAHDLKNGVSGGVFSVLDIFPLNHRIIVDGGVLMHECSSLMRGFFQHRR